MKKKYYIAAAVVLVALLAAVFGASGAFQGSNYALSKKPTLKVVSPANIPVIDQNVTRAIIDAQARLQAENSRCLALSNQIFHGNLTRDNPENFIDANACMWRSTYVRCDLVTQWVSNGSYSRGEHDADLPANNPDFVNYCASPSGISSRCSVVNNLVRSGHIANFPDLQPLVARCAAH